MDNDKNELAFLLQQIADQLIEAGCFNDWKTPWPDLPGDLHLVNERLFRALELAKMQSTPQSQLETRDQSYRLQ